MKDVTIISNDHAKLVYHPDVKIIHHTLLGGEGFRDVLNTGVDTIKKYGAVKWLSDDRGISYLPGDLEWSLTDWLPRAVKAGWKYWALVVPDDLVARVAVSPSVEACHEQGVRVMVFSNLETAMEWLSTADKKK